MEKKPRFATLFASDSHFVDEVCFAFARLRLFHISANAGSRADKLPSNLPAYGVAG